jgi:hypothetical protein
MKPSRAPFSLLYLTNTQQERGQGEAGWAFVDGYHHIGECREHQIFTFLLMVLLS